MGYPYQVIRVVAKRAKSIVEKNRTNKEKATSMQNLNVLERTVVSIRGKQTDVLHNAHPLTHTAENGVLSYS